jgi:ABC-type glycerol-3-phosphate transport system permease component
MAARTADDTGLRLAVRYLVLILIAIIFVFPLVFMAMSSLKPQAQLWPTPSSLRAFLPVGDISLDNYRDAFRRAPVATFVVNSVIVTGVTVISCRSGLLARRLRLRLSRLARARGPASVILATLIVPFETIAIPLLLLVSQLPWIGWEGLLVRLAQHLPRADHPVDRRRADDLPLRAVFQGPAARADRGEPGRGRELVPDLPQGRHAALRPGDLATAAILKFLVMYNQYLWPLIVVQQESYRPVMVGLATSSSSTPPGARSWPTSPSSRCRCWPSTSSCNAPSSPRSPRPGSRDSHMVLALDDQWIWDSWYAHDGDRWHAFFLKADKSLINPDLRHFNVSQGHACQRRPGQLGASRHLPRPSEGEAWDDYTTWTGSVVRDDGLWHLFYTGSRNPRRGSTSGSATRPPTTCTLGTGGRRALPRHDRPERRHYEADHERGFWHDRAMRDPWVMRDPEGDGWLMFFTARAAGVTEPNAGGAIGFATSPTSTTGRSAARLRRRLRPARGAAGLRGGRPLVLPLLHLGRALLEGAGHRDPRRPRHRLALPDRRRPARARGGSRRGRSSTARCPAAAMRRASSTPAAASSSWASPTMARTAFPGPCDGPRAGVIGEDGLLRRHSAGKAAE